MAHGGPTLYKWDMVSLAPEFLDAPGGRRIDSGFSAATTCCLQNSQWPKAIGCLAKLCSKPLLMTGDYTNQYIWGLPSGKRLHNYGKSPFFMGKSTISMAIFKSYVSLPEGIAIHSGNPYQPTKGRPKKCCLTI